MGQTIDLPDASTLAGVEPQARNVCLAVLMAVRDRAEAVRFEQRHGAWVVRSRRDGAWVSFAPLDEAADVPATLRHLTMRTGVRGWASRLFQAGRFRIRVGEQEVECLVSAEGPWACELSLRPSGGAAMGVGELLSDYWQLGGYRDSRSSAD